MHFDPTVQVAAISSIGLIIVAMLEGNRRHSKSLRGELKTVKHQVQNSHETNLRDDVDQVLAALETVLANQNEQSLDLRAVNTDIRQLRTELGQERTERLSLGLRLDGLTGQVTLRSE